MKPAGFAVAAALALAALSPTAAHADASHGSGHDSHGSGHDSHGSGHASHGSGHGSHGSPGHDMGSMPGGQPAPEEHGSEPGHTGAHGSDPAEKDRPVGLVLAGFGILNALVLLAALILRHRPAAVKRRETLARVRRAAGAREPDPAGEVSS